MNYKILRLISRSADHNYCSHYNLKDDDIYVEAGAYIGRFITKYIRRQHTGLTQNAWDIETPIYIRLKKTILIEPCTWSTDILKYIIDNDIIENGLLIEKAISSKIEKRKFIDWEDNHTASRLTDNDNSKEIQVDTIDNIVNNLNLSKIDLLCGDVEGEELNMIKGAEKSLEKGLIKNIAICTYHKNPDYHNEISEILMNYNYEDIQLEAGITFAKFRNLQ